MSDDMIIDLSNYKDRVGARVMPDTYRVQVEDVESTKAASGNPMVNLWFRIVGGEFDGQTIVDRLVLTEKSMFRVVGFMQAIGLPTPKKRLKLNIRQFLGKTLDIEVADGEPYNGRIKSEVRGYMRVAKAASTAADDDLDGLGEFSDDDEVPETDAGATDLPDMTEGELPAESKKDEEETIEEVDLDEIEL